MAGAREIGRLGFGIDRSENRHGPVFGRNSCRDAFARIDGDRERRTEGGRVLVHHQRKLKFLHPLRREGQADQSTSVSSHEIDGFGGDFLGGHDEIAFVFAILVVHEDHHAAMGNVRNGVFDAIKCDRAVHS